jgi:predicted O-linked N-acetylglucosamine transferase (SPINDLY family)
MRGRFASGILRTLDLPEFIAESDDGYIELVARVARDLAMRTSLRERIARARPAAFGTIEPVRSLERFALDAAHA